MLTFFFEYTNWSFGSDFLYYSSMWKKFQVGELNDIRFLNCIRVIWKVIAKTPICILKEEREHQTILCTNMRPKIFFGLEYEATNE